MNDTDRIRPLLGHIQDEHRVLHRTMKDIAATFKRKDDCHSLAECGRIYGERLSDLREHLCKHFAEEETGGCLEEAVCSVPHLASQVSEIEHEHPQLLQELDQILRKLSAGSLTEEVWSQCAHEFEKFKDQMLAHEKRENQVFEKGFNVPLDLEGDE
jgi:hypothetical protein